MRLGPGTGRRRLLAAVLGGAGLAAARPARAVDLPAFPIATAPGDAVAPGHARDVLIRWGDRVIPDARPWAPSQPLAAAAETQFGWDGRLAGFQLLTPGGDSVPRAMLAVTHPTVDPAMAFPGGIDRPEVAAVMQGASILNLEKQGRRWVVTDGGYQSRRLTANTLCRIAGPLEGRLGGSVRGVLGLSGGGFTPWGTLLLAEGDPSGWSARLRGADSRFAETAGFGWVAEIDASEPTALPAKRTALGRMAHGDVAAALTRDGRAVVYQTEYRRGGLLFRFVSRRPAATPDALDQGTLSVARVEGDRLRWIDLPPDPGTLAEIPVAGAQAGGTGFSWPSGVDVTERNGPLLLACRGEPGANEPGYLLLLAPAGGDHGSGEAGIATLILGGSPARPGQPWPEFPESVAAGPGGLAWIGTDRGGRLGPRPDLLFAGGTGLPQRGPPMPLYAAPRGAAIGGSAVTPDGETVFALVRTPGAEPGASWTRPGTRWPGFDAAQPPRTALIALSRLSGGRVGG